MTRLGKQVPKHISLAVTGHTLSFWTRSQLPSQPAGLALAWAHEAEIVPRSAQVGQLYPEVLMPGNVHLERGPLSPSPSPQGSCSDRVRGGEANGSSLVWRGEAQTWHPRSFSGPQWWAGLTKWAPKDKGNSRYAREKRNQAGGEDEGGSELVCLPSQSNTSFPFLCVTSSPRPPGKNDPRTNQWKNTNRTLKARLSLSIREYFREALGRGGGEVGRGKREIAAPQTAATVSSKWGSVGLAAETGAAQQERQWLAPGGAGAASFPSSIQWGYYHWPCLRLRSLRARNSILPIFPLALG